MNNSKYALITGASRGIGNAAARQFAKNGYNLILTCRKNYDLLMSQCADISSIYNVKCMGFLCDGSSPDSVRILFDNIKDFADDIEVLANNAGISIVGLLQDMSDDEWRNIVDSNLSSVFYMCRAIIPSFLKKKHGRIINVSSVWGEYGASCEVAYSATKGGINSFSRALGKELAPSGITVNTVAFGAVDTEMNSFLSDEERDMLIDEIPSGHIATPDEAGHFIYQVSQLEPYITGQILSFNGGWF